MKYSSHAFYKGVVLRTSDGPPLEGVLHDHVGELVERAQHPHQVTAVPQDHLQITQKGGRGVNLGSLRSVEALAWLTHMARDGKFTWLSYQQMVNSG